MALLSAQNLNSLADEVPGVTSIAMQRDQVVAVTAFTSGTLYARNLSLPPGLTVNNLDFWMVGASTTPSHQWMVLMSTGGVVLAVTADNVAGQAANTYYRAAVTVPFTTPVGAPQLYYIGVMCAATTPGTFGGSTNTPNIATFSGVPAPTPFPAFVTGGAGLTTPVAIGAVQALTAVGGATANLYAATA